MKLIALFGAAALLLGGCTLSVSLESKSSKVSDEDWKKLVSVVNNQGKLLEGLKQAK